MEIVYDEIKQRRNLRKHGFDFADLTVEFFAQATVVPAKKGRLMAIGVMSNGLIAVVFVTLGTEGISVISFRRASRKERAVHEHS